jgi:hypothetical protein
MEAIFLSETSSSLKPTRRHNPEHCSPQSHNRENLKPNTGHKLFLGYVAGLLLIAKKTETGSAKIAKASSLKVFGNDAFN